MGAPVVLSINQFCDENGIPYANGTIDTWVPGTTTGKSTFTDPGLTALNPNPVRLDSAGRCVMWADGDLRLVLRDAAGNLVWDQLATTIVSDAMEPVVSEPTIPDALNLLGVTGLIAAEATARSNADSAEQTARIAGDNTLQANIDAEATARFNADNTLYTEFTNADTNLQNQINALPPTITNAVIMQTGTSTSDNSGNIAVTYPTAFATQAMQFIAVVSGNPLVWYDPGTEGTSHVGLTSTIGRLVHDPADDGNLVVVPNQAFTWYVTGL